MTAKLTRSDLRRICASQGFPQVSFHLPMERVGAPLQKNRVQLRNAMHTAERKLLAHGLDQAEANELLRPVRELAENDSVMLHQLGSMSLFVNAEGYERIELPTSCNLQVEVGERMSVLPLLDPVIRNMEYAVLTLSLGGAGLYHTNRFSTELVELPGLPEDLAYVLRFDHFEKSLQQHSAGFGGQGQITHGHGTGKDDRRSFVDRFVSAVEAEVTPWLEKHQVPLLLMGAPKVVGHYQRKNRYRNVIEPAIHIDPFTIRLEDIIRRGWELVQTRLTSAQSGALDRYHSAKSKTESVHTVLPALTGGHVATLFVNPDEEVRGSYDPATGLVHLADGREAKQSENLINTAVIEALHSGAEIVLVDNQITQLGAITYSATATVG